MKAIIKRDLKNYSKNPIFWIGLIMVVILAYQDLKPYLDIHYVQSDYKTGRMNISDIEITDGYVPSTREQQRTMWEEYICKALVKDLKESQQEAQSVIEKMKDMKIQDACSYLEENYHYYGAYYAYEDLAYHPGSAQEINQYIDDRLSEHSFFYYFSKKFADFGGLYMGFFATFLLAFLFLQDMRKNTYELLHTKPVRAWEYIIGKVCGGFLTVLSVLAVLNIVFAILCTVTVKSAGFHMNLSDVLCLPAATAIYILPNMVMIVSIYAIVALLFKNPLPAVPLLLLYMVYSNMGSRAADGSFGYYGRPLAIMVRFPGYFFETTPPPLVLFNQTFLLIASVILITLAIRIWRRRKY